MNKERTQGKESYRCHGDIMSISHTLRPRPRRVASRRSQSVADSGESWWAKRWIAVLESFNIGARLGRGRSYARNGQVLSIDIEKGVVKAKVQGSRTKPYEITINVKPLSQASWRKLM